MPAARRRHLGRSTCALAAVAAALSAAGCFKPNVLDGGFLCSPTGKACPDGFRCGADGTCRRMPVTAPPDSGVEAGGGTDGKMDVATDGGGEASACTPVTPLCAEGPGPGEACSPSCQRGCGACERCNVVDGKPACVPAGTVKLGELCNASADDCAPGLICLLETCGNGLARCYQHCTKDEQCDGTACTINIEDNQGGMTSYYTCDVPPHACNPVDGSGCPSLSFNCYLTNANQTLCDCPGTKTGMNNDPCTIYNDCAPGFICIAGVNGQTTPHCHFVCDVTNASCPSNGDGGMQTCSTSGGGAKYGYCSM
ncbi:MAG TPA: hypothetical protein VHL80_19170 [Polyangia bacterium]|nr:hypothetical protein [Polyangia bacterium]